MIVDDAGFSFAIQTERTDLTANDIVALVPYTRYAKELTEEYRKAVEQFEAENNKIFGTGQSI